MCFVALNILARWCRNITVQMPPDLVSKLPGWVGGFCRGTSGTRFKPSQDFEKNPIGPAFASCLGVAEVFRQAVGLSGNQEASSWYSLFDFSWSKDAPDKLANPTLDSRIELGRIQQVGCGAVASSLDQLIALTEWTAAIDLIDYDRTDPTNCNRSLAFYASDCVSDAYKADVCDRVLKTGDFHPRVYRASYAQFVEAGHYLEQTPDIILCLANEQNVWSTIQNNLPPLVFHATTTRNWGTNFGRHIPKMDWCLMCRFEQELNYQFVPNCGEGQLVSESFGTPAVEGVLPFLSPAASVILLSELAKVSLPGYPFNSNFVTFSLRRPEGQFLQLQKPPRENCLCKDQPIDIYPPQIKSTKYWDLTVRQL